MELIQLIKFIIILVSIVFTSCNDYMNGPIRNIYVYGVINNRIIVAYRGSGSVLAKAENKGLLKEYLDTNYHIQNQKYGDKNCRYAEFQLPPLPSLVLFEGQTIPQSGRVNTNKPAVEYWVRARIHRDYSIERLLGRDGKHDL